MRNVKRIRARKSQRGYALLLVAFAATLMVIAAMTAAPGILTEGKREKEKEMIWRGNQYVRGIKLYYRKTGKFPNSLDDLTKPQVGNIRFMRQQYKDPMNLEDGSWRLIYVGPSGQLIGSLKPQPQITLPGGIPVGIPGASGVGTPAANLNGAGLNGPVNSGVGGPVNASPTSGFGQPSAGQNGVVATTGNGVSTDTDANGDVPANLATDTPTVIGGNIIGIGSKATGRSVIVWEKAKNYRLFEFYWDPSKDVQGFGPQPTQPGNLPPGVQPATPQNFQNPGMPPPNFNPSAPSGTDNPPLQGNPPQN